MTNNEILEKYPFLRFRDYETDELIPLEEGCSDWYDCVDVGWKELFLEMCEKLKDILVKNNSLEKFRIEDVKEKYGSLRVYHNSNLQEVIDLVNEYESKSSVTCVLCGKEAKWESCGWICPYCDECKEDAERKRGIKFRPVEKVVWKKLNIDELKESFSKNLGINF